MLAEKVAEALASELAIDGKSVRIGCTTGISIFPRDGADQSTLTKDEERITLQVLGDGPLGGLTVEARPMMA